MLRQPPNRPEAVDWNTKEEGGNDHRERAHDDRAEAQPTRDPARLRPVWQFRLIAHRVQSKSAARSEVKA
jgi:hypothetical protein